LWVSKNVSGGGDEDMNWQLKTGRNPDHSKPLYPWNGHGTERIFKRKKVAHELIVITLLFVIKGVIEHQNLGGK